STTTVIFQYFFFSSRRRHTRFSRDWSSDVCSSDSPFTISWMCMLITMRTLFFGIGYLALSKRLKSLLIVVASMAIMKPASKKYRSEERRVGKQRRIRTWPGQGQKDK